MTIKELASKIAKIEGKKSQARIGDIREILGILSDLMIDESQIATIVMIMLESGIKRLNKKKKK